MRINNNLMAVNTTRQLNVNNSNASKSMEKLSSGLRINKAGDDAAGLAISEKMRAQVRGLNQASKNAQDGISLLQTAEGGLNETHSILQRMRELAVQGANDTLQTADRSAVQTEMDELGKEVTRIADKTTFNGAVLLKGTFGVGNAGTGDIVSGATGVTNISVSGAKASTTYTLANGSSGVVTLSDGNGNAQQLSGLAASYTGTLNFDKLGISITVAGATLDGSTAGRLGAAGHTTIVTSANAVKNIQIGANSGEELGISIGNMDATALGVDAISVADNTNAKAGITAIESAIGTVSAERSKLGAWSNRLEHTINNLGTSSENLQSAESRIRDVDMASEMVEYTKNDILNQAAQAMLSKANQAPQNVLQLLR
jgi:flagellin